MSSAQIPEPNRFARRLFAALPGRYERLAELLSLGQNSVWRAEMITHAITESPSRLLDVATGPAGVALEISDRSSAQIVGIDLTFEMLQQAHRAVANCGRADRIALVNGRGEQMPFADATFDALTFTYLLRYVTDPQATLKEIARVVRPGAAVASMEFYVPPKKFWHFWWWGFTRLVLPIAGAVTGGREWYRVGRFLGPNISNFYRQYPLEWLLDAWREAGFVDVHALPMSLGGGLVMWGRRANG